MAKLYAECQGSRGPAHRLGNKNATAKVQTYNSGVFIEAIVTGPNECQYNIYKTKGSNGFGQILLNSFVDKL